MKRISRFIDYIYYRTYYWYKKHGDAHPKLMACIVITLLFLFFVLSLCLFCKKNFIIQLQTWLKWLIGILYFSILGFLLNRYSKLPISKFDFRWKNETKQQKRMRGWGIVFLIVGLFLCVLIGNL